MLVIVEQNRFGHVEIEPKSDKAGRRLRKLMDAPPLSGEALLYLQSEDNIGDFLAHLPPSKAKDVRAGWRVLVRIPEGHIAAYCGIN
jgi:hypothetical protein